MEDLLLFSVFLFFISFSHDHVSCQSLGSPASYHFNIISKIHLNSEQNLTTLYYKYILITTPTDHKCTQSIKFDLAATPFTKRYGSRL